MKKYLSAILVSIFIFSLSTSFVLAEDDNITTGNENRQEVKSLKEEIKTARENAKNEIFNVCSGKSTTLKDFATECKKIMNSNCRIDFGALKYRENEVWNMVGDNSKIKKKLNFKVNFDIKEIISEIVN